MLAILACTGCLVGPTSYRLDFPKAKGVVCAPVRISAGWTFDPGPTDPIPYAENRQGFAVRWETPDSGSFLLAGSDIRNGQTFYSHEHYRINLIPRLTIDGVSDSEWQKAVPAGFIKRPANSAEGSAHGWIPPRLRLGERSFPLSGKIFWNAPEVTRRSQRDIWILGISYTDRQGVTRPKAWAHFDVFSTATGRRVLSAKGEAPQLPPFSQFEAVGWLGDSILLMPHNGVGTHFDACYFLSPKRTNEMTGLLLSADPPLVLAS
jgi:hypothetical protein